jgi:hypothetical protein
MAGEKPICLIYRHIPSGRRAFCTSRSAEEAARFAMRKVTSVQDSGVIVVFDGSRLKPGVDCRAVKDSGFFDEQEVAVFAVQKLKPLDLLEYQEGKWVSTIKSACGLKTGHKKGLMKVLHEKIPRCA